MKVSNILLSLAIMGSATAVSNAQLKLPTKNINGQEYYYYQVKKSETIYGISHKLKVSQEDILKYNPTALDGLKNKQMLFFPVADFSHDKSTESTQQAIKPVEMPEQTSFTHTVEKGETLYGLSKLYNVSQEEIIAANPDVSDGLKTGQVIKFTQDKQSSIFITVKQGATLFSTAKKYNTSVERIMRDNPGVSPSNFKSGEVIKITPNTAQPVEQEKVITEFYPYEIKKGDTFYSISREKNITVAALMAANPGVEKLKKGNMLYIPVEKTETVLVSPFQNDDTDANNDKAEQIYNTVHNVKQEGAINIALMLPYMLQNNPPAKSARLFTEFYKGFLLAVDEVRYNSSKSINIYTYDTENSASTISSILRKDELKKMDLIFAPDNAAQISQVAKFGKDNGINVVNTFSTKNEDYINNSHFIHLNIPHSYMNTKVIDLIDKKFSDYEVIFLNCNQGETKELATQFKKHIEGKVAYKDIPVNSVLAAEDLSAALEPGKRYLIVPNSGNRKTLNRIMPALVSVKDERVDTEIALLGYPEWTTYLNDHKENMHKVDTYIYSRFFVTPNDSKAQKFEQKFNKWYGENMIYAAPQFGMLGYDTGRFFLEAYSRDNFDLSEKNNDFRGLQTDFTFERTSNWSGFINKSIYIIHFTPYNTIEKILR